jgi:hypothetical protein
MLNLQLNIQPQTEQRLRTILTYTHDEEMFAQNIISYQINELQKSILNIRLDLKQFEEKYQTSTDEFYRQFQEGISGDSEDFIVWSGIYEMFRENERRLRELR